MNVYRCVMGVDMEVVPGGCAKGWPVDVVAPGRHRGVATMNDIAVQDALIASQKVLLQRYRCLFAAEIGIALDDCRAASKWSDVGRAVDREAQRLAELAHRWDGSARVVLAVVLPDGSIRGVNRHLLVRSASAVKPVWAAAAMAAAGRDAVDRYAHGALALSDNTAAGRLIDLAGGIDAVNAWAAETAKLGNTRLAHWFERLASSGLRPNLTTAQDLALFYARLHQGELLGIAETSALQRWLRDTPRQLSGFDGALPDRLPRAIADRVVHKTGWLPPECCRIGENVIIDAGLVTLPDGGWFAIAAASSTTKGNYSTSVNWVALAACRIYVAISQDTHHQCHRPQDPNPQ